MAKRYVFGVWHGGNGYGRVEPVFDVERFATITDATDALRTRERVGHWTEQTFNYVHRAQARVLCSNVDSSSMDVYVVRAKNESEALRIIFREGAQPVRYSVGHDGALSVA